MCVLLCSSVRCTACDPVCATSSVNPVCVCVESDGIMSRSFVRSSKYRHVFGTPYKKDKCYDNIRISKAPHEGNMCDVNGKFMAVVLESQGGGAFLVAPLEKVRALPKSE